MKVFDSIEVKLKLIKIELKLNFNQENVFKMFGTLGHSFPCFYCLHIEYMNSFKTNTTKNYKVFSLKHNIC